MVNDFFLFLAGLKIFPQCQNRKFAKFKIYENVHACAAPLGFAEPNQFLPIGMCVLSYTVACFVLQIEKICKLRFRIPLSLFLPATIQKEQRSPLCLVWQQASITNVLTRQPQNVSTLWSLCLGFNIGKRLRSFKVAKQLVSNYYIDFISFARDLL